LTERRWNHRRSDASRSRRLLYRLRQSA
jgi:hypothetical protein